MALVGEEIHAHEYACAVDRRRSRYAYNRQSSVPFSFMFISHPRNYLQSAATFHKLEKLNEIFRWRSRSLYVIKKLISTAEKRVAV